MFTKIKEWPARKKVIAVVMAVLLVVGVAGGTLAWSSHQVKKKCASQVELFTAQAGQFDAVITQAKDALELAIKPADYADGYASSDEGKAQVARLKQAIDKTEQAKADDAKPDCVTRGDLKTATARTDSRTKTISELNNSVEDFNTSLDKWRLSKASEQAKAGLDKAKTALDQARKDADGQIGAVDGDSSLSANEQVKAAYDELKKAKEALANPDFEVKTGTLDEAVASAKKLDELNKKITDLNAKTKALADAINVAKAPAQATPTQQGQAGVGQTNNSWSYNSGGGADQSGGYQPSGGSQNLSGYTKHDWSTVPPVPKPTEHIWGGQFCPNHPGSDFSTYKESNGWTQESAEADCGKPVRQIS